MRDFVGIDRDQAHRVLVCSEPSRSFTRAGGRPKPRARDQFDGNQIAVLGAAALGPGDVQFAAGLFLVDREQPSAAARQLSEDAEHAGLAWSSTLMTRPRKAANFASSGFSIRNSARSPTPAAAPGSGRRGIWMRIFGGSPFASSSHSVGVAISSPSSSRPVISAIRVSGQGAGSATSCRASRWAFVGAARAGSLQLDAVGVLQAEIAGDLAGADLAGMRADEGDDGVPLGKAAVALLAILSAGLAGALLRRQSSASRSWRREVLAAGFTGARALLAADIGLRLGGRFLRRPSWRGFGAFGVRIRPWLRPSSPAPSSGAALRLAAALGCALVDQRDGFVQRDRVLGLVARDRRIDPAGGDIGAVAAVLDRDAAEARMIAERLAGIGAEAAAARAFQRSSRRSGSRRG